jgi:hypothetical protein
MNASSSCILVFTLTPSPLSFLFKVVRRRWKKECGNLELDTAVTQELMNTAVTNFLELDTAVTKPRARHNSH